MNAATFTIQRDKDGQTLAIQGDWSSLTLGSEALELPGAIAGARGPTRLDLSKAGRIDTAGAYLILKAALPTLQPSPLPGEMEKIFALVRPAVEQQVPVIAKTPWLFGFFDRIGRKLAHAGHEVMRAASFSGRTWVEIADTIRSPSKLRVISLAHMMEVAGVDALPIIMLLNFFI